jgi:uncharacterized protein (DUF1684 family)
LRRIHDEAPLRALIAGQADVRTGPWLLVPAASRSWSARSALRLKTFVDDDQLFVMFRDRTNGREICSGGRFLHAPPPQNGVTTLDFNKIFNPLCSVNDYVVCPVDPAENLLSVSVTAGQKYDGGESH